MKKYFKTDISRQQKIIMTIVLIVIFSFLGLVVYSWVTPKNSAMQSKLGGASLTGTETAKNESPQERSQTDNFNKQESDQAIKEGKTYLVIPTGNPSPVKLQTTEQAAPPVFAPSEAKKQKEVSNFTENSNYSEQTIKAAAAIVKSLQANNTYPVASFALTHEMPDEPVPNPDNLSSASNSGASSLTANKAKPVVLYEAFKICPAQLNTELDTDTNSIVTATLSCGELYHATLQAPGYKLVGENIDMTFTAMTFEGKSYKINAKPIDLDTGRSMLTGDVNHRYLERIVLPALALSAAKYGSLFENSTEQSTYVSDGTIVQSSSGKVSNDQVKGAFVGGLGQQTANVLNADASRIPPINVQRGNEKRTIGITFLEPVLSTDAMDVTVSNDASVKGNIAALNTQPAAAELIQQQQQLLQSNAAQLMPPPAQPGISYAPRQQAY